MNSYRSFSVTVPGGSHEKNGLPCQDSSFDDDKDGCVSIAIVADGHGDGNCFRSDRGAKFAVECAKEGIREFVKQYQEANESLPSRDEFTKLLREKLITAIVHSWKKKVWEDYEKELFTPDELVKANEKYRERYNKDKPEKYQNGKYIPRAYGTTLIAAAITPYYWFGFHIGDGRFTVLYPDGRGDQPVPWDPECYLNIVTSICDDDVLTRDFGVRSFLSLDREKFPIAVFLCSDGVDDNYPVDEKENKKQLCRIYRIIAVTFAENGYDDTCAQLKELANGYATKGKGDDTSIAGFINIEEMRKVAPKWKEEIEKAEDRRAVEKAEAVEKATEKPVDAETIQKAEAETVIVKEAVAKVKEAAGKITEAVKTAATAKSRAEKALEAVKSARDRDTYKNAINDVKAAADEAATVKKTAASNLDLAKQAAAEATAAAVIKDTNKSRAKNNEPYIEQAEKDAQTVADYADACAKTYNEAQNIVPVAEKAVVKKAIDEAKSAAEKAAAAANGAKKAKDSAETALSMAKDGKNAAKAAYAANEAAKKTINDAKTASEYVETARKAIASARSAAVSKIAIEKVDEAQKMVNKAVEDTEIANNDAMAAGKAASEAQTIAQAKATGTGLEPVSSYTKPLDSKELESQGTFVPIDSTNNAVEIKNVESLIIERQISFKSTLIQSNSISVVNDAETDVNDRPHYDIDAVIQNAVNNCEKAAEAVRLENAAKKSNGN